MCTAGPLSSVSVLHFLLSHWQFWKGFLKLSSSDCGDFLTTVVTTASEMWRAKELPKMLCSDVRLTTREQCGLCCPISVTVFTFFFFPSQGPQHPWFSCEMGVREGFRAAKLTTIIAAAAPSPREVGENLIKAGSLQCGPQWQRGMKMCWDAAASGLAHVLSTTYSRVDHKFFFSKSVKNILPSTGDQMSGDGSKILN